MGVALLFLFLLCFPKGGIKLGNIPITWGYLFFFMTLSICLVTRPLIFKKKTLLACLALIPFQCISLFTLLSYGTQNIGYIFSFVIHFFLMPWAFLLVFPQYIDAQTFNQILSWIKGGVFFIGSFGIFLFFYKILTGSFLEIPLLTINYHDRNELELLKCIDRGGIFKLISTYNNGNLYGVCVLMLLPIYQHLETSRYKQMLVKLSLILTLSRTIWAGLILYELCIHSTYSTKWLIKAFKIVLSLITVGLSLILLTKFFPFSWEFLFDRFLGNRLGQFEVLHTAKWVSTKAFEEIFEIIYLGVLKSFGILGLITFLIAMTYPIFTAPKSFLSKPILLGLILYLIVACGDGALLLIPVMCFYWFLVFLLNISDVYKKQDDLFNKSYF
ncbi:MAG: hypothetical protein WCG10_00520 [Chlamydiota bacterium]